MDMFEEIFKIIENRTGICVNEGHRNYVINFVNKRIAKHPRRFSNVSEYTAYLLGNEREQKLLIDEAAINETYFFREESHFEYLQEKFFPQYNGKPLNIWSAACSSGEESVSLYAMASAAGCIPTIFATDIDSKALQNFRSRTWKKSSIRNDGQKYKMLLDSVGEMSEDGENWSLNKEDFSNFHISSFNLISDDVFPFMQESIDLIFLRNVFIYFSRENQMLVLKKMWHALKPGGLLFLSINEIASIDKVLDPPFEKAHDGTVFYFRKLTKEEGDSVKQKEAEKQARYQIQNRKPVSSVSKQKLSAETSSTLQTIEKTTLFKNEVRTMTGVSDKTTSPLSSSSSSVQNSQNVQSSTVTENEIENIAANFLNFVSENRFIEAEKYLEGFTFKSEKLEYKYYLLSKMYNQSGDTKTQMSLLDKAVIVNPKFWPAWMDLGFLYLSEHQTEKQQKAFKKAYDILKIFIAENRKEFDFVVESFDLSYFLKLCENYI